MYTETAFACCNLPSSSYWAWKDLLLARWRKKSTVLCINIFKSLSALMMRLYSVFSTKWPLCVGVLSKETLGASKTSVQYLKKISIYDNDFDTMGKMDIEGIQLIFLKFNKALTLKQLFFSCLAAENSRMKSRQTH